MNEYKENTIGWWLSQLKEPLRSRALDLFGGDMGSEILSEYVCYSMAQVMAFNSGYCDNNSAFWEGAQEFFEGLNSDPWANSPNYREGWDMARECAPETEGVVLPRSVTEVIGNSGNTPTWNMSNDLAIAIEKHKRDFLIEFSRQVEKSDSPAPEVWVEKIPLGKIESFTKGMVERAVVGYQEPLPIDTIEKKHGIRIQNLEARVKQQADEIGFLKSALDFVIEKVGKLSKNE